MASPKRNKNISFFQPKEVDDPDARRINLENYSSEHKTLFELVLNEDVDGVRTFFARDSKFESLNNDRDFTRAISAVTIDLNRDDILQILMDNGARVGGNLFTAIREGSKDCVRVLLPYIQSDCGDIGPGDVKEGAFVSPLMLACHLDDFDIIELLISQGYKITEPMDSEEEDSGLSGSVAVNIGTSEIARDPARERPFLLRVNSYHALANPLYIAYSYIMNPSAEHPIFRVFELNKKLKKQMIIDYEFRSNYMEYSKKCEGFAVDLLEQCHTVEEIKELTEVMPEIEGAYSKERKYIEVKNSDAKGLTVMNLAIRNRHDELVAHPYSQLQLNMVLYQNIYRMFNCEAKQWRRRGFISRGLYGVRHTLLLPFIAILHILAPDCRISNMMKNPVVKFYSHTGAFILFVVALILSSFEDQFDSSLERLSILDVTILAFVIGLFVQETKELYFQGRRRYIHQWWNILSLIMVVIFLVSFLLQFGAYMISGNLAVLDALANFTPTTSYKASLLANSLFSIAMVLSFIHMSHIFQVSSMFGPLQLSLYRLILDVIKFLLFFFMLFLAFGFSLRKVYTHYISTQQLIVNMQKQGGRNITKQAELNHPFSAVKRGLFSLFWSVFGLTELQTFETKDKNFAITTETGQLLFGFFQVLIVIVAVNMLIAMMTRSYEEIADNADMNWKVSRTRMWMNWVDKGSVLPPPFNLIPNTKNIAAAFMFLYRVTCGRLCSKRRSRSNAYQPPKNGRSGTEEEEGVPLSEMAPGSTGETAWHKTRRNTIKRIVERYIHKRKEDTKQEDSENIRHIKEMQERMLTEMREYMGLPLGSPLA